MRALALTAVLLLAACSGQAASTSPSSSNPAPSSTGPTAPTSPPSELASAAPSESPIASKPVPSGPCIDTGELADNADVVLQVIQGLVADLKVPNADQARADAGTAVSGLNKLADLVAPATAEAAKDFRTAASLLNTAMPKFPGGASLVGQAQSDVTTGLLVARTVGCPN